MNQQNLFHGTLEEAISDAVTALGGAKKVACALWPAKTVSEAQRRLLHCLDPERDEKLSLGELLMISNDAAAKDCHTIVTFLCRAGGYKDPERTDPMTEAEKARREIKQQLSTLVGSVSHLQHQLDRLDEKEAQLRVA